MGYVQPMNWNAEATRGRARRRLGAPGIRNENEQRRLGSASDRGGGQNSDSDPAEASARRQVRATAQGEGEPGPARAVCGGGCCSKVGRRRGRRFRGSSGRRLKQAVAAAAVEARRQRAGETPAWEADTAGHRASPRPEAAEALASHGRVLL